MEPIRLTLLASGAEISIDPESIEYGEDQEDGSLVAVLVAEPLDEVVEMYEAARGSEPEWPTEPEPVTEGDVPERVRPPWLDLLALALMVAVFTVCAVAIIGAVKA